MTAFLAIVQDTWRQSKHQWVMILLIAVVVVYVPFAIFFVEVREAPDGSKFLATVAMKDNAQAGIEGEWNGVYGKGLRRELGYDDEIDKRSDALNEELNQLQDLDFKIKSMQRTDPTNPEIKDMIEQYRRLEQQRDKDSKDLFELRKYVNEEVQQIGRAHV